MRAKKTSRFRLSRPAPREKPPQISPIFISDKVTLHVSREKDGKLHWSTPDGTIRRSFTRTVAGKLTGRRSVASTPRQGGAMTPPSKTRTPPPTPLVFHQLQVPLTCIQRAFFALAFLTPRYV
jgi:hypothetical protein